MRVRHQQDADAGWSPVRSMGKVPDPYVNLGRPGVVEQLPDGRLHVVAQERNRARLWEIYQSEPGGGWGPWQRWPEGAAPKPLGIVTTPLRFRPDGRPEAPAFTSIDNRTIDNRTINCRPQGACELVVFGTRVHGPELLRHPLGFGDQG